MHLQHSSIKKKNRFFFDVHLPTEKYIAYLQKSQKTEVDRTVL